MAEFFDGLSLTALALWACAGISIIVFAVMLYSIATFHRPAAENTRVMRAEVLWAIVPIAIVIAMAAPAVKSLVAMDGKGSTEMAHQPAPGSEQERARESPQKTFNEGVVPL